MFILDTDTMECLVYVHEVEDRATPALTPDGRRVVLVDTWNAYVTIVDEKENTFEVDRFDTPEAFDDCDPIALSPDGSLMALGDPPLIFDLDARVVLQETDSRADHSLAFSPDGKHLVAADNYGATVYHTAGGTASLDGRAVAFSTDGRQLAMADVDQSTLLKIGPFSDIDALSWQPTKVQVLPELDGEISGLRFSPDARYLAIRYQHGVRRLDGSKMPLERLLVLDVESGQFIVDPRCPIPPDRPPTKSSRFGFDTTGRRLFLCGSFAPTVFADEQTSGVLIYDTSSPTPMAILGGVEGFQGCEPPPEDEPLIVNERARQSGPGQTNASDFVAPEVLVAVTYDGFWSALSMDTTIDGVDEEPDVHQRAVAAVLANKSSRVQVPEAFQIKREDLGTRIDWILERYASGHQYSMPESYRCPECLRSCQWYDYCSECNAEIERPSTLQHRRYLEADLEFPPGISEFVDATAGLTFLLPHIETKAIERASSAPKFGSERGDMQIKMHHYVEAAREVAERPGAELEVLFDEMFADIEERMRQTFRAQHVRLERKQEREEFIDATDALLQDSKSVRSACTIISTEEWFAVRL